MTAPSIERSEEFDDRSDGDVPDEGDAGHRSSRDGRGERSPLSRRRRERRYERMTLGVLFVILVVVTFGNQWGKFAADTKPDLYYAPQRFLQGTLSAWLPQLGQAGRGNFNTGMAPVAVVILVIRRLGLSPWLTIRVWRLGLYLLAAWGMRRYFHDLIDGHSNRLGRTVVTVLYVANAFVITQGNTTPELLPYALLPWLLLTQRRSLRQPRSWRVAAEFALVFFAMTGMNAGVVPIFLLLAVPCQSLAARIVDRMTWRDQWRSLFKLGVLSGLVSLYWLLPTALASGTGAGIAAATESPTSVAQTTSYAEVSRLLGHWPTYGRYGSRLYEPGYVSYVTSPWVLGATFLVPVLAALAVWWAKGHRRRLRVTAGLLLAVAVPVEVGMFPPTNMSIFGHVIEKVFATVPATLAFRTTSKVGPLVLLGLVLCVGIGAVEVHRRSRPWSRPARYGGALLATAIVATSVYPALSNHLYDSAWNVPGYWRQAASSIDRGPSTSRVLVAPGGAGGNYRWGMRSPDDLFPSLFTRTVVSHVTVAGEGEQAANLMAGTDVPLNQGNLPKGSLSVLARYLGAGQVLVRNDTRYEELNGGAPSIIERQVKADPGLVPGPTYGARGQNILRPDQSKDQQGADLALYPLQQYGVLRPTETVRSAVSDNTLLIDGDGFAVPTLSSAGLLDGDRPFRFMGDIDPTALQRVISDGGGIAITDTNRRRTWSINRLADAYSRTLGANDDIRGGDGPSLTLFPDRPDTQSVARLQGVADITASKLDFGEHAYGKPQMAFDSDVSTAWNAGPFGTAKGKQLTVRFDQPRRIDQVGVTAQRVEPSRVTKVLVSAGGQQRELDLSRSLVGVARFPNVTASEVTVTVSGVSPGDNEVGIASVDVPGVVAQEVTRLPTTFYDLYRNLPAAAKFRLRSLPVDVLFTRQGLGGDPSSDEEPTVNRQFEIPQAKSFAVTASLAHLYDAPPATVESWQSSKTSAGVPCASIGTLDGRPIMVRPASSVTSRPASSSVDLVGCEEAGVQVAAGDHGFRSAGGWLLGTVRFASKPGASKTTKPPAIRVQASDDTHLKLHADASKRPYYLMTGQAYDPRWQAFVDGKQLGKPITLDGYSVAWLIPAGQAHRIDVAFGPQRFVSISFGLSTVALFGVVLLLVVPVISDNRRRRGRRREARA